MRQVYFESSINEFLNLSDDEILGTLSRNNEFSLEITQRAAWQGQIWILKTSLAGFDGRIFFEFSIPRIGKRIDVVLIIKNVIFVLEFKVGADSFTQSSIDQTLDYALDLKNFHETSHNQNIAPILIATEVKHTSPTSQPTQYEDNVYFISKASSKNLREVLSSILVDAQGDKIDQIAWAKGRYSPTPTIVEAAVALYNNHSVDEISRKDASATNLRDTSNTVLKIIQEARIQSKKAICFVTGVPGAGKTLVGLNIASKTSENNDDTNAVFLSGNGPLVAILREALARDLISSEKNKGNTIRKGEANARLKTLIQNVHHFRDEGLNLPELAPVEHVAIFDEAQRAWDQHQTAKFMAAKKGVTSFNFSEPEFLISCMDRHKDWAVIVCLVGGGQEINTGEAGIKEWFEATIRSFRNWEIFVSPNITDSEFGVTNFIDTLEAGGLVEWKNELHLSVSMRSFRAENVAYFVKQLLDINIEKAKKSFLRLKDKYPVLVTRDINKAKKWLKDKARGTERYGIIASSQAQRLRPYAIDVKSPMDPVHWFLNKKNDLRSSFFMEKVATEFHIQGLELDWVCLAWDADFRFNGNEWESYSFSGTKWNNINVEQRKLYLKNAYRVLLTRARQGMIIFVPEGDHKDTTRQPQFYDSIFYYLKSLGIESI